MTIIPYVQGSDEWHALRARHVGASEVAALFDCEPAYALSRYALWNVKAGRVDPPAVDNPRVRWGLRLEPVIAECAAEDQGWTLHKGGYASNAACPGLGASLDYVVEAQPGFQVDGLVVEGPGVLEVKNADWLAHRRTWTEGEPPPHILMQVQAQLAATGYAWGAVACLIGGNDLHLYVYRARPRLIAAIRHEVARFWASIADGVEPRPDGSDGARRVIEALFPTVGYDPADLSGDNELPHLCDQYLTVVEEHREIEARKAELRNQIMAKAGPYSDALTDGFEIRQSITPAKPSRDAKPGERIAGRAESRRLTIKRRIAA